ncbi:hypothetical protein CRYUN_Cryun14cG0059500 [Craigia yunnanensis]
MAEDQDPESIPPRMTSHLANLASICDPDFLELVWEKGQILIRGLSSKISKKSFPCSDFSQSSKDRIQREEETSTANRSKDGDADSTFGDPLSGLSGLSKLDRHDKNEINPYPNCTLGNSLQTGYPELLSKLYEDVFNVVLDPNKKCYDKQSYVSKFVEEIPQQTANSDSEVPRSSLKQYEASIQFMRSKEKKSRIDEKSDSVNFSVFLRPPALLKSNHPTSGATRPTSSPDPESQKESLPDEQSEAVGYKDTPSNTRFPSKIHGTSSSLARNTAIKGNPGNRKSVEQMVASSSVCSRGASNCPTYALKRRYEDTDLSGSAMEESEGTIKATPTRGSKGAKRKRKAEVHNLSERRRRDKINKKMRALQELIPNCNKVDKASMLHEAIEYLKTLQLQVQMMSMETGVYMPPMMLPSTMQHINAQNLVGYSPMAVGMGIRMQMGLGCSPAQFPTSLMSGTAALPGITEARLNMLGFPGQMLLMSMSRSPFVSLAGRFSSPSVQAPGVSQDAAAAQVELPGAAVPLSTSKDSNPTR